MGIDSIVPANISKYTGKSTTCKIKLIGKTDVERDTFPFAIPVKARYQSVQGVTISMIKPRSEEHTSELQSRFDLVCRLLLEKKKIVLSAWRCALMGYD